MCVLRRVYVRIPTAATLRIYTQPLFNPPPPDSTPLNYSISVLYMCTHKMGQTSRNASLERHICSLADREVIRKIRPDISRHHREKGRCSSMLYSTVVVHKRTLKLIFVKDRWASLKEPCFDGRQPITYV